MSDTTRRVFFGTLAVLVAGAVAITRMEAPAPKFDPQRDGNAIFAVGRDGVFKSNDGVTWTNLSESHIRETYIKPAVEQLAKQHDEQFTNWMAISR